MFSCTFFERRVTDLVRPVALGRNERFGPRAGRVGHRARDHALAVLGDGPRIHDEVGRRAQENAWGKQNRDYRRAQRPVNDAGTTAKHAVIRALSTPNDSDAGKHAC